MTNVWFANPASCITRSIFALPVKWGTLNLPPLIASTSGRVDQIKWLTPASIAARIAAVACLSSSAPPYAQKLVTRKTPCAPANAALSVSGLCRSASTTSSASSRCLPGLRVRARTLNWPMACRARTTPPPCCPVPPITAISFLSLDNIFDSLVSLFSIISRINRAHPALLVVFKSLTDFRLRVHHKRPVARDWFVQGHSRDEQYFKRSLRVRRIFDSHFVAVLREQNHLSVSSAFAFCSEQSLALHHVSEGVVSARHRFDGSASGPDLVMQIDYWRASFNDSFLAHRFARDYTHLHQAIRRSRFRNLRARDLLVARFHHLVALRQIYPKLEGVHSPALPRELTARHLCMHHACSGSHPLHVTRSQPSGVS